MFMRLNPEVKDVLFAFIPFTALSKYVSESFEDKDFHAGYFETSLMLYWHPELVNTDKIITDNEALIELFQQDQDAYQVKTKLVDHEFTVPYIKQHPDMKIGVMGDPSRASREYGEKVCKDAVCRTVEFIRELERRKIIPD